MGLHLDSSVSLLGLQTEAEESRPSLLVLRRREASPGLILKTSSGIIMQVPRGLKKERERKTMHK